MPRKFVVCVTSWLCFIVLLFRSPFFLCCNVAVIFRIVSDVF